MKNNVNSYLIRIPNFEDMTGAIISQFYWKNEFGKYSRYFASGSFFFIKPDLAITAYSNLAGTRSHNDMVYAEDYLYFDSGLHRFDSALKLKDGIQCIRIERDMLKEFPDKNITEIHFDSPVSQEFFKVSDKKLDSGHMVLCEGYNSADPLVLIEDPETIDFLWLSKQEARKIKLHRQYALVEDVRDNEGIYTDFVSIEDIDVLFTTCFPNTSMIGGPILTQDGMEVLGVLSHETDDPYSKEGLRGVKIAY